MHRTSRTIAAYAWAFAGIIVIAVLVVWLVLYLLRDQKTLRDVPSHACRDNISRLIEAQHEWAHMHNGVFASDFSDLYPGYISSLRTFQCPSATSERLREKARIDELCDYEMVKGLGTDVPGTRIFIYDKEDNHKHARNVGFVDGTIKEMHEFEFRQLLKKQKGGD
jgi:hypothetical protein